MNCKRIKAKLDLLAGDDLSGRDAAEVEAHLRQCLSCYREYIDLREMLVAVRAAGRPPEFARTSDESESFVGDVMKRIQGPPPALPRLIPRLAMASGWAAALVLGLTVGWYRWQLDRNGSPPRPGPGVEVVPANPSMMTIDQRIDREVPLQFDELRGQFPAGGSRRVDEQKPVGRRPPRSF